MVYGWHLLFSAWSIYFMLSATAPNRGICCRCGEGAEWQCRPEGLQKGCSGKGHSATAPNHGICCRCGKGAKGQCRPEGLQEGCSGKGHSATAPNRGICCRCGKGAGNQAGKPDRQKPTEQTETGKKRKQSRQGRPDRKQPPGYLRSFEARRMVSTAPSMPTRSVLTTRSYSPMSVHWRPV